MSNQETEAENTPHSTSSSVVKTVTQKRVADWTPGPWTIIKPKMPIGSDKEGDRLIGRPETEEHIAEVFQYRNHDHKDEATALANARLIAASPCLFEALVNLLSLCQCEYPKSVWHGPDAWSEAIAARAVIAEVEGNTP